MEVLRKKIEACLLILHRNNEEDANWLNVRENGVINRRRGFSLVAFSCRTCVPCYWNMPPWFTAPEGYPRQPDAQLNPKKKIFEACAPDLKTNDDLVACYKGAALHVPGKGNVVAQTLKNVNVK